jgi:NAD(P)-dependent dehydrogenase (short-subunit alcohol dehydrogenase family)
MAVAFASEGAIVGVADLDPVTAASTVREIEEKSGQARVLRIDVRHRNEVLGAVEQLVSEFGRLDIVANNAIVFRREPVSEVREETAERMISVGLTSLIWAAQAALVHMDRVRGGVIINNTSPAAELGVPGSTVYSAIKGGVTSLTRSLAVEFGSRRIRVNAVCPGAVPTPGALEMNEHDDALYEARRKRTPLGRLGTIEDIAAAAVFLASEEASYITAAVLRIDGGVTVFGGA